jgi:hypothetical protein
MMISLLLATGSYVVAVNVVFEQDGAAVHGGLCGPYVAEQLLDPVVPAGL